jgi:hypothetical protein
MSLETFDYGGDDSSTEEVEAPNELDNLFDPSATSDTKQRPPRGNNSLLAELNMRIVLQVVVAVVLLAVAGGLLARDVWARSARDTAFRQMIESNDRREYVRVIEAAESFLNNQPLNRNSDNRETTVVSLYGEALVHWVAQQPGQLNPDAHARIARYKKLVKSPDQ